MAYAALYQDTKDIMNLKLANLQPNEEVTIQLTYIMKLDVIDSSNWLLRIPATLTPRYVSPTEEKSEDYRTVMKKRPNAYFFTTDMAYEWKINVDVEWPNKFRGIESPTHATEVVINKDGGDHATV